MKVIWSDLKAFVTSRGLSIQYFESAATYYLIAVDGAIQATCDLSKNPSDTTDLDDFESNFKSLGNKPIVLKSQVESTPAFGSKTMIINGVTKKLYARNTGLQQALSAGANTISYVITYPWVKIVGVEVVNSEALDYVDLKVKDTAAGTYSGVPNYTLNQFAYTHNIPKDYYIRTAQFDADIYVGMVIEITYNSVSAKTIGINLIMNEVKS